DCPVMPLFEALDEVLDLAPVARGQLQLKLDRVVAAFGETVAEDFSQQMAFLIRQVELPRSGNRSFSARLPKGQQPVGSLVEQGLLDGGQVAFRREAKRHTPVHQRRPQQYGNV